MILRALRKLNRDQRGFTLIELLVVITILGVLAAIVTVSLLGVTANARENAKRAEKQTVQAAFDAMLSDQGVRSGVGATPDTPTGPLADGAAPICSPSKAFSTYTDSMTSFPASAQQYQGPATGNPTFLATHYLRQAKTKYKYACNGFGDIDQQ